MNRERVLAAIKLMERAENLDMRSWQAGTKHPVTYCTDVEKLHSCNNKACFGGYLALSIEWKEAGGTVAKGVPIFSEQVGPLAVAAYFDINEDDADSLVYGDVFNVLGESWSNFYEKPWEKVTPQDVIKKLKYLLEEETNEPKKN